ncbi:MAG: hypothetical protein R3B82_04930 [Sandaracinaceae bacterium]
MKGKKGLHRDLLTRAKRDGFTHARIDGAITEIADGMALARFVEHDVDLVVAELAPNDVAATLAALERAAELGRGQIRRARQGRGHPLPTERASRLRSRLSRARPTVLQLQHLSGRPPHLRWERRADAHDRPRKEEARSRSPARAARGRGSPLARAVMVADRTITDVLGRDVSGARRLLDDLVPGAGRHRRQGAARRARAPAALPRRGRRRLSSGLDRAADTLERRRDAARAARGAARRGPHRALYRPRRADHRAPPAGHRPPSNCAPRARRSRQHGAGRSSTTTTRSRPPITSSTSGGGVRGGTILAEGPPAALLPRSPVGDRPALAAPVPIPEARRSTARAPKVVLEGASMHNLEERDRALPGRRAHRGHRGQRSGQDHAGPLGAPPRGPPRARSGRRLRRARIAR